MELGHKIRQILREPRYFANNGRIAEVRNMEQAQQFVDLARQFRQYNAGNLGEEFIEKERSKLQDRRFRHFLTYQKGIESPVGFYNVEVPCKDDPLALKSDRSFIMPESRGNKLGIMMKCHLMQLAAQYFAQGKIDKVVSYHFRESENPEFQADLERIKYINSCFGFKFEQGNGLSVPKSVARLDRDVYDFIKMKFD